MVGYFKVMNLLFTVILFGYDAVASENFDQRLAGVIRNI